jgi:transcriptional regulator with XRE-family HTH domain
MTPVEHADGVWQRALSQPARAACLYAGRSPGNLRIRIVPHDRALLPQTKVFVADAIDSRVSTRLAARRRGVGIDRALLDLLLDARNGTVERLETGRSRIACSRLFQLARILDVPIDWFFDEAQSETPPAEPVSFRGGERQAEARRFVALYARIADPKVRAAIREMVRSLAVASSRSRAGGASAFVRRR